MIPDVMLGIALVVVTSAAPAASAAETPAFDPKPWIEDLEQMRAAFSEKYANFEWAVFEREIDLTDLFARTEARLKDAPATRRRRPPSIA
jgi:hypothetical protein